MTADTRVCACDPRRTNFWPPRHVAPFGFGAPLLGRRDAFCAAFFHVLQCSELGVGAHCCLNRDPRACRHQNVTLVAHAATPGAPPVIVRYTTCVVAGGPAVHAEAFMVRDPALLVAGAAITVYAALQPCHHSGGSDADPVDERSCAELVLGWYRGELEPRGITLTFRCANLYKALWSFSDDDLERLPPDRCFSRSAASARRGIMALARAGVGVTAIDAAGWQLLTALSDDEELACHASVPAAAAAATGLVAGITSGVATVGVDASLREQWRARFDADVRIGAFLAGLTLAALSGEEKDGAP